MTTRTAVLGAGAVGGMLGLMLADAGHDVTLLASDTTSTAVNTAGLTLRSARYGERTAPVVARPWLAAPVDRLFVAVKAPDLLAALARVPAGLLAGAVVAPLLNGIDHVPLLRAVFPQSRVVPMTVAVEATRVAPGVIEHLSPFADYAVTTADTDVAELLAAAGLDAVATAPDESTLLWRKLSFLAPFALLTTHAMAPAGAAREARPDLVEGLVGEAVAAAAAGGAAIVGAAVLERLRGLPATMKSSMLKDAEVGATLELDAIAGPILRAVDAPVTRAVVAEIAERPRRGAAQASR
ncbi:ketopantoate reductase family protein [Pseudonocardia sp. GCM10023141]|uniref:ketopantoate reductase family protein n=1 Tax=Pseudonocardia sp. GCM10023141 TaxID=3252653 RepID=UPI003605D2F9